MGKEYQHSIIRARTLLRDGKVIEAFETLGEILIKMENEK